MKGIISQLEELFETPDARPQFRAFFRFLILIAVVVTVFAILFHVLMVREDQQYSWLTGFYWALTVMTTLGFGDITFHSDLGRAFTMMVLLTGVFMLLIVLPFVFIRHFYAPWLQAQLLARAPKAVNPKVRDHVVVCGYDEVARGLVERLRQDGVSSVLVESDPVRASELHQDAFPVVRGVVDSQATYQAAGLPRARLLVANVDDVTNTNIVITAKEVARDIPILATVVQPDAVDILELAGADQVVLVSERLGEQLASRVSAGSAQIHVVGRYKGLAIAEFPIRHTRLEGTTLREAAVRTHTGVTVAALAKRGHLEPGAPDTVLGEEWIGIAAGPEEQLEQLNRFLCEGSEPDGTVVVIGGGKVGRSTARSLKARGVRVHVIEENPRLQGKIEGLADHLVIGDAADRNVMAKAGIEDAASVILTTNRDDTNIFLSVYCRKLNKDTIIVSRISHLRNIEAIHRAGADFAVSDPQIRIQAVMSALAGREPVILGEGLDLFDIKVPQSLHGVALKDSGILVRTGVAIIAVERNGVIDPAPRPEAILRKGERVIFIGSVSQRQDFRSVFGS